MTLFPCFAFIPKIGVKLPQTGVTFYCDNLSKQSSIHEKLRSILNPLTASILDRFVDFRGGVFQEVKSHDPRKSEK